MIVSSFPSPTLSLQPNTHLHQLQHQHRTVSQTTQEKIPWEGEFVSPSSLASLLSPGGLLVTTNNRHRDVSLVERDVVSCLYEIVLEGVVVGMVGE